jgi:hypothetical protein
MNLVFKILVLIAFILNSEYSPAQKIEHKKIIGQIATVKVKEGEIKFTGRVDTGAKTTSINAKKIMQKGDSVKFTIVNKQGQKFSMITKIADERYVFNAEKREKRYYVYLTLEYNGITKRALVNLNDRSKSTYKILLGRNWLNGDYIVDVSIDRL